MGKKPDRAANALLHHKHYHPLRECWISCKQEKLDMSGFCSFEDFFSWSVQCGFENGMFLIRKDPLVPYSPANCQWRWKQPSTTSYNKEVRESIARFDNTVAKIRAAYKLPPLDLSENNPVGQSVPITEPHERKE